MIAKVAMKNVCVVLCLGFFCSVGLAQKYPCLPSNVKEDSVVSTGQTASPTGKMIIEKTTVAQSLKKLKAKCSHGKLVDGKRKPIVFYYLQGCWGNPPADYLEIMDRQREELSRLKSKNTVIQMTCNSSGMPTP